MDRKLTNDEVRILEIVQAHYGSQNTPDNVFRVNDHEAVIAVTNPIGSTEIMVNLTNLAAWRADGTIASDEQLKRDWLRIQDS